MNIVAFTSRTRRELIHIRPRHSLKNLHKRMRCVVYGESLCQRVYGPDAAAELFDPCALSAGDVSRWRVAKTLLKSGGRLLVERGSVRLLVEHVDEALVASVLELALDDKSFAFAVEEAVLRAEVENDRRIAAPFGVTFLAHNGPSASPAPALTIFTPQLVPSLRGAAFKLEGDEQPNKSSAKAIAGSSRRCLKELLGAAADSIFVHVISNELEFCSQLLTHDDHRIAHVELLTKLGFVLSNPLFTRAGRWWGDFVARSGSSMVKLPSDGSVLDVYRPPGADTWLTVMSSDEVLLRTAWPIVHSVARTAPRNDFRALTDLSQVILCMS
jgi:hypothetical protein